MEIRLWWPDDVCLCSWRHNGTLMKPSMILLTNNNDLDMSSKLLNILIFSHLLPSYKHVNLFWTINMYYSLQGNLTTICILSFLQEIGLTIPFKKPSINSRLTENVLFMEKIVTKYLNSRITNQALKSGSFGFCKKIHKKKVCNLFS